MKPIDKNRDEGRSFEQVFEFQAKRRGLLVIQNYLTARHVPERGLMAMKSNLDFMVSSQAGRVGYFDTKSFTGLSFAYSKLNQAQVERAKLYNDYSIPSGFVVLFSDTKNVIFYSGKRILNVGCGSSFEEKDGINLGKLWSFDPRIALGQ